MATSGSFNTSSVGNFYFTFAWTRTGYSSSKNEHYIYYEVVAYNTPGYHRTVYLKNLWINGSQRFYTAGSSSNGKAYSDGDIVASGNITIPGSNSAGDGYIVASFEAGVGVLPGANCSGESSWDLDRIPRQATLTKAIDFDSDSNPYMEFSNPGGLVVDCYLEFDGTNIMRENVPNTGKYTFELTDEERQKLLSKCPNSNTLAVRYGIQTRVNGTPTWWSWKDKKMYVVNSNPSFSNCEWEDVNSDALALTGSNHILINGFNELQVTIPIGYKAVARNGATMSKYRLVCGNKSIEKSYSSSSDVVMKLDNIKDMTFIVYAIDSRGNSTPVTKSVTEWKNYSPIEIKTGSAIRDGGVGTETTLSFEGTIWNDTFGAVDNEIVKCQYRYKKSNENEYGDLIDIVPTRIDGSFSFNSKITGDIEAEGFNLSNSFNIQIIVKDKIKQTTYDVLLGVGKPAMAIHRDGVSFGMPYDEAEGGSCQIDGKRVTPYKTAIIIGQITGTGRYYPDYSSIDGEVIASVLIGCVNSNSNSGVAKCIPHTQGENNYVSSVAVEVASSSSYTVISILVFYK